MKKLIAMALLGIHLFAIGGHVMLYQCAVYHTDKLFNEQIGHGKYNLGDLVEIKLPVKTQCTQNWDYFEGIHGQVQFKNTCYNYVKLKLSKDTIYLMCIPNYEKTTLINENIINARDIGDIPVNKKDHVPFGKAPDLGKYSYPVVLHHFSSPVTKLHTNNSRLYVSPVKLCREVPEQPPKYFT